MRTIGAVLVLAAALGAATQVSGVDCGKLEDCDPNDCQCQFTFWSCGPFKEEDDKLNATYRRLLEHARDDAALVARIQRAQRAWLAFRDAQIDALTAGGEWGEATRSCEFDAKKWLTERRTDDLDMMLAEPGGNENQCTWVRPLPENMRQHTRHARCD